MPTVRSCREINLRMTRVPSSCFGHRLMMDRVVPGGTAVDLDEHAAMRKLLFKSLLQPPPTERR